VKLLADQIIFRFGFGQLGLGSKFNIWRLSGPARRKRAEDCSLPARLALKPVSGVLSAADRSQGHCELVCGSRFHDEMARINPLAA